MADDLNDQFDLVPKLKSNKRKIDESDEKKKKKRKKSSDLAEKGDTEIKVKKNKSNESVEKDEKEIKVKKKKSNESVEKDDKGIKVKRKRKKSDDLVEKDNIEIKVKKKKKKFEKKKSKKENGEIEPPKALTPSSLTSAITTNFKAVLSPLEMDKIQLQDDHFSVCNDQTHTAVSLLHTIMPRVKKVMACNKNVPGRPVVIAVCLSALRCLAFIKQIKEFKTDKCTFAKLFAKHLKLDKMQAFLKTKPIHVAVGTPHRINLLLDNGDICLHSTQHIILDLSHTDDKNMNMLQIKIVKGDLMELLTKHMISHVKNSNKNNNNNDKNKKKDNKTNGDDKKVSGSKSDKTKEEMKKEVDNYPCKIALF